MAKTAKDKSKKEVKQKEVEVLPENIAAIALPLADKKLRKRLFKVVKKATKKRTIKRGVKEVVKGLRKGEKGLVVMAGNISPIDVLSHVPVVCEDNEVPYVFVHSKEELGFAVSTKRPTSCIMIVHGSKSDGNDSEFKEQFDYCKDKVTALNTEFIKSTIG